MPAILNYLSFAGSPWGVAEWTGFVVIGHVLVVTGCVVSRFAPGHARGLFC